MIEILFIGICLFFALIYCLIFVSVLKNINRYEQEENEREEEAIGTAPVEKKEPKAKPKSKSKKKGASKKKAPSAKKKKK